MPSLPFMSIHVSDHLAETCHLKPEQLGAYWRVLLNYWQTGKPVLETRIQGITGLNNDDFAVALPMLKEYFSIDKHGFWHHEIMEKNLSKTRRKVAQSSAAGKASAKKRASSTGPVVVGLVNGR